MTLYRETPCQHGQMRAHLHGEQSGEEFPVGENMLRCPGGSREEVTIYTDAAISVAQIHIETNGPLSLDDPTRFVIVVQQILDAALHTEKETTSIELAGVET